MYTFDLTMNELHGVYQMTGDAQTDEMDTVKSALTIYDGFIDAVEDLGSLLQDALQEVK